MKRHRHRPTRLTAIAMAVVGILLTGSAFAHGGFESETEVRVEAGRMRVVVRSSLAFAWKILGNRAPDRSDDAGKAAAKPLLAAAARGMFEVTAGGQAMTPVKTDCFFEEHDLHEHAAFTMDFDRPAAWPVTVKATFFEKIGELDEGTLVVLDHTASRFQRDVEPLLKRSLSRQSPAVTFDLGGATDPGAPAGIEPAPAVPAPVVSEPPSRAWLALAALAAIAIAGRVVWRRSRRAV